jgi:hypothetical protein
MNEWLAHPAVQGGVAPFLAALLGATLLAPLRGGRFAGLAIALGFATAVALAVGWSFESMSSIRKLSLVGLGAGILVVAAEFATDQPRPAARVAIGGLAALAAVWVMLGVLRRMEPMAAVTTAAIGALFVSALVDSGHRAAHNIVGSAAAALVLGLSAGALALLGASAVLALLGIAVGAGAGAVLLVQTIGGRRIQAGWTLTLPATAVAGLVAVMAVLTGGLRWYVLLPMLAIPWAVRWLPTAGKAVWLEAILATLATSIPAALALVLAWSTAASASP